MFLNVPHGKPWHRLKIGGVVKDFNFPLSTGIKDRHGTEIFERDIIHVDTDAAFKQLRDIRGDRFVQASVFDDDDEPDLLLAFIEQCRDVQAADWFGGGKIFVRFNIDGFFLAVDAPRATGYLGKLADVAVFSTVAFDIIGAFGGV